MAMVGKKIYVTFRAGVKREIWKSLKANWRATESLNHLYIIIFHRLHNKVAAAKRESHEKTRRWRWNWKRKILNYFSIVLLFGTDEGKKEKS